MKIKSVAQGSLVIAIIVVSFFLIRGAINILNALIVPTAIFVFSMNKKRRDIFALFLSLVMFCMLFFQTQIVFLCLYFGIAQILLIIKRRRMPRAVSIILLSLFNASTFWAAILLTDQLFGLGLNRIMLIMYNYNRLLYTLLFIVEGSFASIILLFVTSNVYKRTRHQNNSKPGISTKADGQIANRAG